MEIEPAHVAILRHQDNYASPGRNPYELWRDDRPAFDFYQCTQNIKKHRTLSRPSWASFVGMSGNQTLFAGLYRSSYVGILDHDRPRMQSSGFDLAGQADLYSLEHDARMEDLEGRLLIHWGGGERAFVQGCDRQNKPIAEIRAKFSEPAFPGFLNLILSLSQIATLPKTWVEILKNVGGIYLLTCPTTKEQYVGSAGGGEGFWQRWLQYAQTGHGGNVRLKSREPSDYQVTIL
jgi:hypothetical protein